MRHDEGFGDDLGWGSIVFVLFMFLLLAIVIMFITEGVDTSYDYKTIKQQFLVSLERGTEIEGGFVLGFGTIDTSVVYYAYEEVELDTYVLRSFKSRTNNNIRLVETDDERPQYRVRERKECRLDTILWKETWQCSYNKKYELLVPRGTIRRQFNG